MFFEYLISGCWRKLYRRVRSWQVLGFISNFNVGPNKLALSIENYKWNSVPMQWGPGDRTLAKFLINNGKIVEGKLGEGPLLDAARGSGPLYTRETANDFHSLTFKSLIAFGRSLCDVQLAFSKYHTSSGIQAKFAEDFKDTLWLAAGATKLVFYILCSTSFRHHILMLCRSQNVGRLMPIYHMRNTYMLFGQDYKIWLNNTQMDNSGSSVNVNDSDEVEAFGTEVSCLAFSFT
jgi:hypothetical protein